LKAIRRRYGRNRNYIEPLTEAIIRRMIDLLLSAKHGREGALAPLSFWRSVWSTVSEFNTLTRFSDAIQLRVTDLSFPSQPAPHLSVSFAQSKNDQYSEGSQRLVASLPNEPKYCPVRQIRHCLGPVHFEGQNFTAEEEEGGGEDSAEAGACCFGEKAPGASFVMVALADFCTDFLTACIFA